LAIGGLRRNRAKTICAVQPSAQVEHWVGKLTKLTTNSEGLGVITVAIGNDIFVSTWNNFFSDKQYGTLIDPDTDVSNSLEVLEIGQRIKFSGSLIRDQKLDCFQTQNLRMDYAINQPVFTFRFSDVQTYQP